MSIEYFNTTLEEYRVIYPKGTPDYITKDNFDNVYVIPLEVVFCFELSSHNMFIICSYFITDFSLVFFMKFVLIRKSVLLNSIRINKPFVAVA